LHNGAQPTETAKAIFHRSFIETSPDGIRKGALTQEKLMQN
jgi:hypothetical protein